MKKTSIGLLHGPMHPQGVGRRVPGGNAATPPLAALRGARFLVYLCNVLRSLCSVRLTLEPLAMVYKYFPIIASAITLLTITPPSGAAELGRLFFTPEQRAQLESGQQPDMDTPDSPHELSVNGIVQRHGGERMVWINGVPQIAGRSDERAPESVPVAIPGQSQPVRVKVGQKVLLNPSAPQKTARQDSGESDN